MSVNRQNRSIVLLIIFYIVGVVGLSIPESQGLFTMLTPANLLWTLILFLYGNKEVNDKWLSPIVLVFLFGFGIEWIGVHTGVLFGVYNYGSGLGFKLWDIPLIIGVNWVILAFASHGLSAAYFSTPVLKIISASILMVLLDFFIEPVAVKLDFWSWENGLIPLQNYVMWFIAAALIHSFLHYIRVDINKKVALAHVLVQFVFFISLNFIL